MPSNTSRHEFSVAVTTALAKRASYICSMPDCRALTLCPSAEDPFKSIYVGRAAHITAASPGGPRFEASLSQAERSEISNAIFLCTVCADMIDKNKGLDFPADVLRQWKVSHEAFVRKNLNKSIHSDKQYKVNKGELIDRISNSVSRPARASTEGARVLYKVKKLKQNLVQPLESLFIVFRSWSSIKSFTIDYRINLEENAVDRKGQLSVTIRKPLTASKRSNK